MGAIKFVIITADFHYELEDYAAETLEGDTEALATLIAYAQSLQAAAESASATKAEMVKEVLEPVSLWIGAGAPLVDFQEDEESFEDDIVYGLEAATEILGELMVPVSGDGYDPEMDLGRVSRDQIPSYDPSNPRLTLGDVSYSLVDVPEELR